SRIKGGRRWMGCCRITSGGAERGQSPPADPPPLKHVARLCSDVNLRNCFCSSWIIIATGRCPPPPRALGRGAIDIKSAAPHSFDMAFHPPGCAAGSDVVVHEAKF